MIVLDTNVLSEALKRSPSDVVLRWLAAHDPSAVFTTTLTQAEILYGIVLLPPGKRRVRLSEVIEKMFAAGFQGGIQPFDEDAACTFAKNCCAAARCEFRALLDTTRQSAEGMIAPINYFYQPH